MTGTGTRFRLKIAILAAWSVGFVLLVHSEAILQTTDNQSSRLTGERVITASLPPDDLIDNFDRHVQSRFLTEPRFGISRLGTREPTIPHLDQFQPKDDAERSDIAAFETGGWDVGMYLFGRVVTPRTNPKKKEEFETRYRLFNPIPVSQGLKGSKLRPSKKLITEIKQAFLDFQTPGSTSESEMRFASGKWTFVARPVRAVNESCVQCHKDNYVITEKLGGGMINIRKRRVGDANGVIVYAFAKRDD